MTPAIDELIGTLHGDTLRGCWPEGRRSVDAGYRDIEVPFDRLAAPAFALETRWNLAQLIGYLRTWSAVASIVSYTPATPSMHCLRNYRAVGARPKPLARSAGRCT